MEELSDVTLDELFLIMGIDNPDDIINPNKEAELYPSDTIEIVPYFLGPFRLLKLKVTTRNVKKLYFSITTKSSHTHEDNTELMVRLTHPPTPYYTHIFYITLH